MNKRNIIIVAMLAMILMGSVVLSAVTYQINVHIDGVPVQSFFKAGVSGYWNTFNQNSMQEGDNYFEYFQDPGGAYGWAWARAAMPMPASDEEIKMLHWLELNEFNLDITGLRENDPTTPIEQ